MRTLVAILLCCAGCSLVFVERPPLDRKVLTPVSCTESYALPLLDALGAAAGYAATAVLFQGLDRRCGRGTVPCDPEEGVAVVAPLFAAVPLTVSAVIGRFRVARCRSLGAWQREEQRRLGVEPPGG